MPALESRFYTRLVHQQPKYSNYETYEARLKTFAYWPISLNQKNTELASAGFFYSGVGDKVECFHCGLKYNNWLKDEIPKNIHAKLSGTRCYYAQITLGKRFIDSVSYLSFKVLNYNNFFLFYSVVVTLANRRYNRYSTSLNKLRRQPQRYARHVETPKPRIET